jgi:hypothetical protein
MHSNGKTALGIGQRRHKASTFQAMRSPSSGGGAQVPEFGTLHGGCLADATLLGAQGAQSQELMFDSYSNIYILAHYK